MLTSLPHALATRTHSIAVVIFCASSMAFGAIIHVTPSGSGTYDGSSWSNALGGLQAAVDVANSSDEIRMQSGLYSITGNVVISGFDMLYVKGGYSGDGNAASDSETIITRDPDCVTRIMMITNSTVTLDSLSITGGTLADNNACGMGIYSHSSDVTLTNCVVSDNFRSVSSNRGRFSGAGLYARNGSLTIFDSLFTNNYGRAWSDYAYMRGGAIYSEDTEVEIARTTFDNNRCNVRFLENFGGAICMIRGSATLSECLFTTNAALKSENYTRDNGRGGAIYASGLSSFTLSDSTFIGNYNNEKNCRGGTIFLEGSSQKTVMSRCVFFGNGCRANAREFDSGSIYLLSGSLYMTNTLHASNGYGNSLDIYGGTLEAVNCTFANNANGFGVQQGGGTLSFRNCIIWGNQSGAYNHLGGTSADFTYSCLQESIPGLGNFSEDPLFADDVFFHPKSIAGVYMGGYFTDGTWGVSEVTSPTIDSGGDEMPFAAEPQPNRHRSNIGYDANTQVASKSVLGDAPVVTDNELKVFSYPASDVTRSDATVCGEVASNGGGADPSVVLVWDSTDKGTLTLEDWGNFALLGTFAPWTVFSNRLAGISGTVFYRFAVSNETGIAWSSPAESFQCAELAELRDNYVTHLTRHTARIYGDLFFDGNVATTVGLRYWPIGNEDEAVSHEYNNGQPVQSGTAIYFPIDGLAADAEYAYNLYAVNSAGTNALTSSFSTLSTAPIVRYVTTSGAGIADGTSWDCAYSNLQDAVVECLYEGDLVCMKSGVYRQLGLDDANDYSQCRISGTEGLTIRGGYAGSGSPGERDGGQTVLARDTEAVPRSYRRIIRASQSRVSFDSLVISNGSLNVSQSGHGLLLESCDTSVTNCVFTDNGLEISAAISCSGAAICANNGTLRIADTLFTDNYLRVFSDNAYPSGGAIYALNLQLFAAERCEFVRNCLVSLYKPHNGGALSLESCDRAVLSDCLFATNNIARHSTETGIRNNVGRGGALYAYSTNLEVSRCKFLGNYGVFHGGYGGVIGLNNSGRTAVITESVFADSGIPENETFNNHGDITLFGGSLAMTNVLIGAVANSNAVEVMSGTLEACNVTVAGAENGYGIWMKSGSAVLKNSIIWHNSYGGFGGNASAVTMTYCDSQDGVASGEGNFSEDPLFADNRFFHLSSRSGYYAGGFFDGGIWKRAKVNSSCIDAGDETSPYEAEPHSNGKRVNLGAYGNTSVASLRYTPDETLLFLR